MSANFDYSFARLLEDEGGYVSDGYDPGGETKYGISKRSYPDVDIEKLTLKDAFEIYLLDFWETPGLDLLDSKFVADEVFNTGVNTGMQRGVVLLQRALNTCFNRKLKEDGLLGPKTASAANMISEKYEKQLVVAQNCEQYRYYLAIKDDNPSVFERFIKGWLRRCRLVSCPSSCSNPSSPAPAPAPL